MKRRPTQSKKVKRKITKIDKKMFIYVIYDYML